MEIKIIMPLKVEIGVKKKKLMLINMNAYRNWNKWDEHKTKERYERLAIALLRDAGVKSIPTPMSLSLKLYKRDKRSKDKSNFLSIHEKYFCDALANGGFIPDDSDDYIYDTYYAPSEIDKMCPRVEITINTIDDLEK